MFRDMSDTDTNTRADTYEQFVVTPLALAIGQEIGIEHITDMVADSSIMEYDAPSYVSPRIEGVLSNDQEINFWEVYDDALEVEGCEKRAAEISVSRFRETDRFVTLSEAIAVELGMTYSSYQW